MGGAVIAVAGHLLPTQVCFAASDRYLVVCPRYDRLQHRLDHSDLSLNPRPRGGLEHDDGKLSPRQLLLIPEVLIGGEEDIIARTLRGIEQGAIGERRPPLFIGCRNRMADEVPP